MYSLLVILVIRLCYCVASGVLLLSDVGLLLSRLSLRCSICGHVLEALPYIETRDLLCIAKDSWPCRRGTHRGVHVTCAIGHENVLKILPGGTRKWSKHTNRNVHLCVYTSAAP